MNPVTDTYMYIFNILQRNNGAKSIEILTLLYAFPYTDLYVYMYNDYFQMMYKIRLAQPLIRID